MEITTINYEPHTLGTPEENAKLAFLERRFFDVLASMMNSLKQIKDMELYKCRGCSNMKEYLQNYLAKIAPFSVSFSQSLLAFSYKLQDPESLRVIEESRIAELGRIANEPRLSILLVMDW